MLVNLKLWPALLLCAVSITNVWAQIPVGPEPWVLTLSQPVTAPAGIEGKYLPTSVTFSTNPGTAAERKVWDTQMRAVQDYLQQVPVFAQPRGSYPEFHGFGAINELPPFIGKKTSAPFVGGIEVFIWPPSTVEILPNGTPKRKSGTETGGLRVEFNYQYLTSPWLEDDMGEMGRLIVHGEYQGFPIVNDGLLITKDSHLPYRPVSRERAIRAWLQRNAKEIENVRRDIAEAKANYEQFMSPAATAQRRAEMERKIAARDASNQAAQRRYEEMWERKDAESLRSKANPDLESDKAYTKYRNVIAVQKLLETMVPADLASEAWIDASANPNMELGLLPVRQGVAIVEADPTFFDPRRPHTQIRCAWVRKIGETQQAARANDKGRPDDNLVARTIFTAMQQVNWRDFADRFLVSK